MSERKVLNKYYPPDFDPSKIPRMKLAKNRQYTVRLMAPFNMRCVTCGEYIYKGKKFNARKEDVEGQDYLGIRIYRFYIKCTRCLQEISFKTDPQNTDYEIEAGATRNFMALKLAEEQAQKEEDERKEDESTNPMKLLENRTKQSKQELELLESLEELRDLNRRQRAVDYDQMLVKFDTKEMQRQIELKQQEDDEKYIKSVFGAGSSKSKVIEEVLETEDGSVSSNPIKLEPLDHEPLNKKMKTNFGNDDEDAVRKEVDLPVISMSSSSSLPVTVCPRVTQGTLAHKVPKALHNHSIGLISKKGNLNSLVRLKKSTDANTECVQVAQAEQDASKTRPTSEVTNPTKEVPTNTISSGLSLLGSYSDSESD